MRDSRANSEHSSRVTSLWNSSFHYQGDNIKSNLGISIISISYERGSGFRLKVSHSPVLPLKNNDLSDMEKSCQPMFSLIFSTLDFTLPIASSTIQYRWMKKCEIYPIFSVMRSEDASQTDSKMVSSLSHDMYEFMERVS